MARKVSKAQIGLFDGTGEVLTGFHPSAYQRAIFEWLVHSSGDAMVRAVAGSGKTTTLIEAARLVRVERAIFCAFNKHIADTLRAKLKGTGFHCSTIHGVGYGVLAKAFAGKPDVQESKYRDLARQYVDLAFPVSNRVALEVAAQRQVYATNLHRLINFVRMTLTDPRDTPALVQLARQHGIILRDLMAAGVEQALAWGAEQAAEKRLVDFTDMIYLPLRLDLPVPQYEAVFVDEAQDLNVCQRELVLRLRAPGGRYLFVGDPRQSIMGFAGADTRSYDRILEATNAAEFPLSVCYRCPELHVQLAQLEVPEIESRPGAPLGTILSVPEQQLPSMVEAGDLVLCRMTAPLIGWCLDLIRRQIPARVRGRDIARELADLARKIGNPYASFMARLQMYAIDQRRRLEQKDVSEAVLQMHDDMCLALETCYDGFRDCRSVDELCEAIDGLFSDEDAAIWLSTVHRAKGLEADRVFILRPDKLPLEWETQTDEEAQQEHNLLYVALTRAKDTLIFLENAATVASGDAVARSAWCVSDAVIQRR